MAGSGIAKVQHYVPQFLLRNFGNGKKDQLFVFDKSNSNEFRTNAKNVASESRFYDFEIDGKQLTVEPALSQLEGRAKTLLTKLLDADTVEVLTDGDKESLSEFLAVQLIRTKAHRELWRQFPAQLKEELLSRSYTEEQLRSIDEHFKAPTENEIKVQAVRALMDAPANFGSLFTNKTWHLVATTRKLPFIIGDSPLTFQNMNSVDGRGALGLAAQGIEIYLPLSPTRALALWCPSISESFISANKQLEYQLANNPAFVASKIKNPKAIQSLARIMQNNEILPYTQDNVRNFNYLQIRHAERHVFASEPGFALAKEMISDSQTFRVGMRMRMD